jgi:hypothetical protein
MKKKIPNLVAVKDVLIISDFKSKDPEGFLNFIKDLIEICPEVKIRMPADDYEHDFFSRAGLKRENFVIIQASVLKHYLRNQNDINLLIIDLEPAVPTYINREIRLDELGNFFNYESSSLVTLALANWQNKLVMVNPLLVSYKVLVSEMKKYNGCTTLGLRFEEMQSSLNYLHEAISELNEAASEFKEEELFASFNVLGKSAVT